MKKIFITAAKRTAIGKFLGTISNLSPTDIATPVVKQILSDTKIEPQNIDEVIVGNVLAAGHKQGIARQISINSGIPCEVPAYGINMICGSGMKTIMQAYTDIMANQAEVERKAAQQAFNQAITMLDELEKWLLERKFNENDISFIDDGNVLEV